MAGLLSPITIKNLILSNRVVMPPISSDLAARDGKATPGIIDHYFIRAQASVGLILVEHTFVNLEGKVSRQQLGLHNDEVIEGLSRLTSRVHSIGGKVGIQLSHGGTAVYKEITGKRPVGPSSVRHPRGKDIPRELSKSEIKAVVSDFGRAAARAKEAGFDAVEIHGAHGYLLNQFLSPLTNQRTDEYGGDRDSRIRMPLEVVETVRDNTGEDMPLFFRLGGDDRMYGGLTVNDAHWAALRLVRSGIDVIDLSGGLGGYDGEGQGYFIYLAEAVRPVVDIPVLAAGGIEDPFFADRLVRDGKVDLVGIGRALLRDFRWTQRAIELLN